jgi:hypothetical protein
VKLVPGVQVGYSFPLLNALDGKQKLSPFMHIHEGPKDRCLCEVKVKAVPSLFLEMADSFL